MVLNGDRFSNKKPVIIGYGRRNFHFILWLVTDKLCLQILSSTQSVDLAILMEDKFTLLDLFFYKYL